MMRGIMHTTRRQILQTLKGIDRATVYDLADAVGVKAITIRHHMTALLADGLIEMEEKRQSLGRPLHMFSLSLKGQALFRCPYDALSGFCQIDEAVIRAALDAGAQKIACLLSGDGTCAHLLRKRWGTGT
jgi:predicted ArsR family transcriptional regulator